MESEQTMMCQWMRWRTWGLAPREEGLRMGPQLQLDWVLGRLPPVVSFHTKTTNHSAEWRMDCKDNFVEVAVGNFVALM